MPEPVSGLNPRVLSWARERSGLSIHDVARVMKKPTEVIERWEAGSEAPTYVQLETLAYKVLKRPVALFFFPEPPEEADPEHSFRTLPDFELRELGPDTRYRIRDGEALQLALYELHDGRNPSERQIWQDLQFDTGESIADAAEQIRTYLGVSIQEQRGCSSAADAFSVWRSAVEAAGVYVFKNSFKQREVSGFCLYDDEFPLIYINNSTSFTRQVFTLFHELAHLLFGVNGITKVSDRHIGALAEEIRAIEVFCNRLAAELLVPEGHFQSRTRRLEVTDDLIAALAREYCVSREVVLRRFLDLGRVTRKFYEDRAEQWNNDYLRGGGSSGGNYYATKVSYLGERYLDVGFSRYYQGAISGQQLAEYFHMNERNLPSLEQYFLAKRTR